MDLDVTICAIGVLRVLIMLRAGRLYGPDIVGHAMAGQTQLRHPAGRQQTRISRTMRRMTRNTTFSFHRCMFKNEGPLFVRVTLHAGRVRASRQSCLFEFKTAMGIVAVAALHGAFKNLVMER